ncbi:AraC family transcriptional regulator [Novosphingobium sp. TH158]|uniref:helix-turn-helix domain-containing protein n=1 Tax=Novosphingobium sp. TH158 TaxID=2067455 RepID=UPI000C7CD280|nr:AraC family transcriptional regulator [Novosphingobium sp. TH158]PLK26628.1 AraC family transcriptional regulator [Novosphingobium sp. TH158]
MPDPVVSNAGMHRRGRSLDVLAQMDVAGAHIFVADLFHEKREVNSFRRDRVYWIDLCLTPRRPNATASFVAEWGRNRSAELGSLIAFPPRKSLELISAGGGRHVSIICQMQADLVDRWLPEPFEWTDRRLEATLDIASDTIRPLMLRLNHELRDPGAGSEELCRAIVQQIAIELARYLANANAPDERGGLASWRLRRIDERIADPHQPFPTVTELAGICRLSPRQLSRAFRISKGSSVSDHLAQRRIEKAKRRLYSDESLDAIAAELGFASQSTFTTAFRRATGTTPDQFRRQTSAGSGAKTKPNSAKAS